MAKLDVVAPPAPKFSGYVPARVQEGRYCKPVKTHTPWFETYSTFPLFLKGIFSLLCYIPAFRLQQASAIIPLQLRDVTGGEQTEVCNLRACIFHCHGASGKLALSGPQLTFCSFSGLNKINKLIYTKVVCI